jgi:hypothetical protein
MPKASQPIRDVAGTKAHSLDIFKVTVLLDLISETRTAAIQQKDCANPAPGYSGTRVST